MRKVGSKPDPLFSPAEGSKMRYGQTLSEAAEVPFRAPPTLAERNEADRAKLYQQVAAAIDLLQQSRSDIDNYSLEALRDRGSVAQRLTEVATLIYDAGKLLL